MAWNSGNWFASNWFSPTWFVGGNYHGVGIFGPVFIDLWEPMF